MRKRKFKGKARKEGGKRKVACKEGKDTYERREGEREGQRRRKGELTALFYTLQEFALDLNQKKIKRRKSHLNRPGDYYAK